MNTFHDSLSSPHSPPLSGVTVVLVDEVAPTGGRSGSGLTDVRGADTRQEEVLAPFFFTWAHSLVVGGGAGHVSIDIPCCSGGDLRTRAAEAVVTSFSLGARLILCG